MPSPTYVAIAKTVLTGSQATITFSSIPGTYTDLIILISSRTDLGSAYDEIKFWYNNDSAGSLHSATHLEGSAGAVSSSRNSSFPWEPFYGITGGTNTTTNTFSSSELYIPSYAGSVNKVASATSVNDNNTAFYQLGLMAGLWRNTNTITRIDLAPRQGTNFVTGSRFDLYGIKNS